MAQNHFFNESKLDWNVQIEPVTVKNQIVESHKALVRSDNDRILTIHKESYNPFDNVEMLKLYESLANVSGFNPSGFMEAKGGNVILGYLKNDQGTQTINGHEVNEFLVIGNTHDGSKGIFVGTSSQMIRCMNQWGKIVKSNVIKHTKNNQIKISELQRAFEIYFKDKEKTNEIFTKMAKINIDADILEALTLRLFEADTKHEKISTRKQNQMDDFSASVRQETNDLGMNLFGFFNSVTHYTTHVTNQKEVVFGNLTGTNEKLNTRAFNLALELVH
jgi:hypothetical protein